MPLSRCPSICSAAAFFSHPFPHKVQTLFWAGGHAVPAPDTCRRTGDLLHRKGHRAGPLTSPAMAAGTLLPPDLDQAKTVKPAVDRPQRAQILAERPIDLDGEQTDPDQDPDLPEEQPSRLAAQHLVPAKERDRPQQRPGGTQIFAKSRDLGKAAEQKHRAYAHQPHQSHIPSIS